MFLEQNKKVNLACSGTIALLVIFMGYARFRAKCMLRAALEGDLSLNAIIILDCQTKTAIPCSEDCIVYKTCTAHIKRR